MTYTTSQIQDAFDRVRSIDSEHGRDPNAYLRRIGLPRTAVDLSFRLADEHWAIVAEHLQLGVDSPLNEVLRDEVRQAVAAATLRGIVIGEMIGRA